ncbi:pleckstrin homology domain-containing family G member 3-like [Lethenteron reissneri]|uniref:pleckstrin homology domain-containing family G member 3-like n=1 Tax=Lethenteron reissneri TaxID=7753 RepID=UPI002AB7A20A|nr:pleckstrin homology domain-containing family G member 3-like [Lethenteron reissneri]XP_061407533.1 pleckstrin homology domain-containing family G member 3-like [Lethenteron reissneri]
MLSRNNPGGGGGGRRTNPRTTTNSPVARPSSSDQDGVKMPSSNGGPKSPVGRVPGGGGGGGDGAAAGAEWLTPRRVSHRRAGAAERSDVRDSGTSPIAAKVLTSANPKLSYVDRVVLEILETERMYVRHLKSIVEDYLTAISQKLPNDDVNTLFGNIKEIYKFNSELLGELEDCGSDPVAIAECFVEKSGGFEIYTQYCTNFPSSMELLTKCMRTKSTAKFFRDHQAALKHNLPLGSFLLKPVQRILKYHLLLQEIEKRLDKSTDGYEVVQDALSAMHGVAWHINEMKRKHEHAIRIQELRGLLINLKQDLSMLGDLALEGSFRLHRTRKERALFLFDSSLLIAKKRDDGQFVFKTEIKCRNLMILEQPRELEFCVWHYKNEKPRYTFQAKTQEEKSQWIHHIKRLILENHPSTVPDKAKNIILEMDPAYPTGIYSPNRNRRPEYHEVKERKRRRQAGDDATRSKRVPQEGSRATESHGDEALSPAPSVEMLDEERGEPSESSFSDRSVPSTPDTSLTPDKAQNVAGKDSDVENGPAGVRSIKRERPNFDAPIPFERQPSWKRVNRGSVGHKTKKSNYSDFSEDPPPEPMNESASSAENLARYEVSIWDLKKGEGGVGGEGIRSQPPSLCSESTLDDTASKFSDLDPPAIDTSADELDDDTQTECSSGDSPRLSKASSGLDERRGSSFADIMQQERAECQVRAMLSKPARRSTQELVSNSSATQSQDGSADEEMTVCSSPVRQLADGAVDRSSGEDTVCTSPVLVSSQVGRTECSREDTAIAPGFFPIGSPSRKNSTDDEEFFSVLIRTPSRRVSRRKSSFRVENSAPLNSPTSELGVTVSRATSVESQNSSSVVSSSSGGSSGNDVELHSKVLPGNAEHLSKGPSAEISLDFPAANKEEPLTSESEITDKARSSSPKVARASSFSKQDSFPLEETKNDYRWKDRVGSGVNKRDSLANIPQGLVRDSVFAKRKAEIHNFDNFPTQKSASESLDRRVSSPSVERASGSFSRRRKSENPREKSDKNQTFVEETKNLDPSEAASESHAENVAKQTYGVTVFSGSVVKLAAANESPEPSQDSLNSSSSALSDAASINEGNSDREPPKAPGPLLPTAPFGNEESHGGTGKYDRATSRTEPRSPSKEPCDDSRMQSAGRSSKTSTLSRPTTLPSRPRVTFTAMSHSVHFSESNDKSKSRVFNMARQYSMRIKKPKSPTDPTAGVLEQLQRSDALEEKLKWLNAEENKLGFDKAVGAETVVYPKVRDSGVNKRSSVLSDTSITAAAEQAGSDRSSTASLPPSPGSFTSYSPRCLSPTYVTNRFFPEPSYFSPKGGVNWPTVKELRCRYLRLLTSDGGGDGGGARAKTLERHSDGRRHGCQQIRRISSETGTASTGTGEPRSESKRLPRTREDLGLADETKDESRSRGGNSSGSRAHTESENNGADTAAIHLGKNFPYIVTDDIPVFDSDVTLQDSPGVVVVNGTSCVGGRPTSSPAERLGAPLPLCGVEDDGDDDDEDEGEEEENASPAGASTRERKQISIKPAAERWGPREGGALGPEVAAWQRDGNKRRGIAFGGSRALSAGEGIGIVKQLRDMFQRLSTSSHV